jgi:hypothetical protein
MTYPTSCSIVIGAVFGALIGAVWHFMTNAGATSTRQPTRMLWPLNWVVASLAFTVAVRATLSR